MNEVVNQVFSSSLVLLTGVMLGLSFYSGLWWTTHKVIGDAWSPWWFIASFIVRTSVVMAGFYLVAGPNWRNLLICLCGFLIARLMVALSLRSMANKDIHNLQTGDKHHAP